MLRKLLSGLVLILFGCSGGSNPQSTIVPPLINTPQPSSTPTAVTDYGCQSEGLPQTSESPVAVAGVWFGTLVNCVTDTSTDVSLRVGPDGRFHMLADHPNYPLESPDVLSGRLANDGNLVTGSGTYFSTVDEPSALWVDGRIDDATLIGRWRTEWGGYGYFQLDYDDFVSNVKYPGRIVGDWEDANGHYELKWHIREDGQVEGLDTNGCKFGGRVSFPTNSNAGQPIPLAITISNCFYDGEYKGLIHWDSGSDWDRLRVSVDDGKVRALSFTLVDTAEKRISGRTWGGSTYELSWRIALDGSIDGEDSYGCQYSGQIQFAKAEGEHYPFELVVAGCSMYGNYAGSMYWSSGPFEDQLHVSAADQAGQVLEFTLLDASEL